MNLTPIRANMTEVDLGNGRRILFSYKTPVAYTEVLPMGSARHFKTAKRWSNTTTRHINQWLAGAEAGLKPQEWFDNLLSEVK